MRDQLEGGCEIALHEAIAGLEMAAVRPQKSFRSTGIFAEPVRPRIENVGVGGAQRKAVAGQRNRRRNQRDAWEPAVFGRGMVEPHHRTGHAGGKIAVPAEVGDEVSLRIEIHHGSRSCGGGLAEVDERFAAIGEVDRHETAAPYIAAARVDDGERVADRNRRIDRIAAGLEDMHPDFRGQPMRGYHHAVLGLYFGSPRGRQ